MADNAEASATTDGNFPADLISVDQATKQLAMLFPSASHPQDYMVDLLFHGVVMGQVAVFGIGSPSDGWTQHDPSGSYPTFVDADGVPTAPRFLLFTVDAFLSDFMGIVSSRILQLPQDEPGHRQELVRLSLEAFGQEGFSAFRGDCFVSMAAAEGWLRRQQGQPPKEVQVPATHDLTPQKETRHGHRHPLRGVIEEAWQRLVTNRPDPWSLLNRAETRQLCLEDAKAIRDEEAKRRDGSLSDESIRQWWIKFEENIKNAAR